MISLASELHPSRSCVPFGPQALLLTSVLVWHSCCIRTKHTVNQPCLQIHTLSWSSCSHSLLCVQDLVLSQPNLERSHLRKIRFGSICSFKNKRVITWLCIHSFPPLAIKEMSFCMLKEIIVEAEYYLNTITFSNFLKLSWGLKSDTGRCGSSSNVSIGEVEARGLLRVTSLGYVGKTCLKQTTNKQGGGADV